jgi:hypothetical protein
MIRTAIEHAVVSRYSKIPHFVMPCRRVQGSSAVSPKESTRTSRGGHELDTSQPFRHQRQVQTVHLLPFAHHHGDDHDATDVVSVLQNHYVCQSAVKRVIGFCELQWTTCNKAAQAGQVPVHGNKGEGNRGAAFRRDVVPDLSLYLEHLYETGAPVVTADSAAVSAQVEDGDVRVVNSTKRKLYFRFCLERGWHILTFADGNLSPVPRTGNGAILRPSLSAHGPRLFNSG